ncbi:MAG: phosphoadenylyl-sulfate reductase [Lentisphaeria bacterium]|nr:phosphoadenylyl-sulfate reductase [Lentisphaeria bacterium]
MNAPQNNHPSYTGDGTAEDVLRWALATFHPRIAIACSFQHTVLIDLAMKIRPDVRVFSIDTGRLPEETYQCARDIERHFGIRIEWFHPKHDAVEDLMGQNGPYSFRESVEARRQCCAIRKVEPLNRALTELDAWITGVRREQTDTRANAGKIEIDEAHGGIVKINPLADWTYDQIRTYVKEHRLPYNTLFEKGYSSIGCACCTRAVDPGEDPRAGRWWWENPEQKECGLHIRNWSI